MSVLRSKSGLLLAPACRRGMHAAGTVGILVATMSQAVWLLQDAAAPAPYQAAEFAAAPAPYQAAEFAAQSGSSGESPSGEAQGSSSMQAEAANQPVYQSWTQQQAPTFGLVGPLPYCSEQCLSSSTRGPTGFVDSMMKSMVRSQQHS